MKKLILTSLLILSSLSFSATKQQNSISNSLDALEQKLIQLERMENQRYKEEEQKAVYATQKLNEYRFLQEKITKKIQTIENKAEVSIMG